MNSVYVSAIGGDRDVGGHFPQDYGYAQVNNKQYRPTEWLFEGQTEGRQKSIRMYQKRACKK